MYRLDADEEDSPAEIEEIPHEKTLRVLEIGIAAIDGSIADQSAPAAIADSPAEHPFLGCQPFGQGIGPVGNAERTICFTSGADGIRELETSC